VCADHVRAMAPSRELVLGPTSHARIVAPSPSQRRNTIDVINCSRLHFGVIREAQPTRLAARSAETKT
jgi:hypothetical protein